MEIEIRRFNSNDADEVSSLIKRTILVSNSKDYNKEDIDKMISNMQPNNILYRASWTHFYVAVDNIKIVGCGAIGPFWDRDNESSLFNIFVIPEYQRMGIGRQIIKVLEEDEYYKRATRIEVPASITGVPFYKKLGYTYKCGTTPDREGIIRLEKYK